MPRDTICPGEKRRETCAYKVSRFRREQSLINRQGQKRGEEEDSPLFSATTRGKGKNELTFLVAVLGWPSESRLNREGEKKGLLLTHGRRPAFGCG